MIQRDLLFIEKHGKNVLGYEPQFKFDRNRAGQPMFEEFAKKNHKVTYDGETFHLFGSPDGIMTYTDDDGNKIRIGLEIKSKQTTAAKTSEFSMREAEKKHVEQCVAYATMYGCAFYLIVYVNTSHKTWSMKKEDWLATPDLRVFGIEIGEEERKQVLGRLASVQRAIRLKEMPPLDLYNFTFNSFKTACALSMSDEELLAAELEAERLKKSRAPAFVKNGFTQALAEVKEIRRKNGK